MIFYGTTQVLSPRSDSKWYTEEGRIRASAIHLAIKVLLLDVWTPDQEHDLNNLHWQTFLSCLNAYRYFNAESDKGKMINKEV